MLIAGVSPADLLRPGASVTTVLEVWAGDDPFAALEDYLDEADLFARGDLVANVFLGYGLSHALRRASWPDPPEPCRLPLLAARVHPRDERPPEPGALTIGEWRRSWDDDGYAAAIEAVQEAIGRGDVYQVNLVQHLRAPFQGDPAGLAPLLAPLQPLHPEPLTGDGWAIVSGSPELFLARRGDRVWTKPIKGTRPAGVRGELRESAKDAAEHVMIVDLERNDLSRVCVPGSVRWPDLMSERELAGVTHMVTTVEGRLREDVGLAELLGAVFPGGSVTGAPKISAVDHIAALEPVGRGASMGALGRIHSSGDFDLALTIRTFAVSDGEIHLWVGGGIVWDSDREAEIEESWVKARPLLAAVGSPVPETVVS
jgi:para-aminobenzoate synthetase component I